MRVFNQIKEKVLADALAQCKLLMNDQIEWLILEYLCN